MMTTEESQAAQQNDVGLVTESLGGNQDAFRQIVERYQTLICSLAYCATGSVSQSEDLAQETFMAAWKQLAELREPAKLRPWLCGIVRFRIGKELRRQGREPVQAASTLEAMDQLAAPEPLPSHQAISNEEKAILWRSLERVPEIYREPLVLFYREEQSVERVAEALDLSEDAVKQRLSRGRKLLQEEFLSFVEGALAKTIPGKAFTIGVVSALPLLGTPTKAAAIGMSATTGGAAAKGASLIGLLGAILCPLLAFLNVFGVWRLSHKEARSDGERKVYRIFYPVLAGSIVTMILLSGLLMSHGDSLIQTNHSLFVVLITGLVLGYPLLLIPFCLWFFRRVKKMKLEQPAMETAARPQNRFWEYRSRFELFGLPFIHLRFGGWQSARPIRKLNPVKAWIAADDGFAVGVLFAYGAVAVAPVSIGAVAIGLFSYGAMAIGALAVGGFGFGIWAFGAVAFGWQASAGCAIAWNLASGGQYAIAHHFALGPIAHAAQVNTEFVRHLVRSSLFFQTCWKVLPYFLWLMWLWSIPLVISMIAQWSAIARKHIRKQSAGN